MLFHTRGVNVETISCRARPPRRTGQTGDKHLEAISPVAPRVRATCLSFIACNRIINGFAVDNFDEGANSNANAAGCDRVRLARRKIDRSQASFVAAPLR